MAENVLGNKWLESMESDWNAQMKRAATGGFANKPDGLYDCALDKCEIVTSKAGDPQVRWDWIVKAGDLEGQQVADFDGLKREDAFYWLGMKLARFGFDPTELADNGPKALVECIRLINEAKPTAQVKLKTNKGKDGKDYQNIYIEKVFYEDDSAPEAPEDPSDPFYDGDQIAGLTAKTLVESAEETTSLPEKVLEVVLIDDNPNEQETAEPKIGMKVMFEMKGVEVEGYITSLDKDDELADVRVGNKTRQIPFSELRVVPENVSVV